jgi:hypothetical protein
MTLFRKAMFFLQSFFAKLRMAAKERRVIVLCQMDIQTLRPFVSLGKNAHF